ncbi:hypothetical protein [Nitrosopumilus sp.]|uniref:hypothetical protein n=1 Tax=Nitrosopumilus sp. TaxID=2024843 RepID=UPI002605B9A2|nr:hypothetical protein [Nitrosopumilus sp.]
MLIFSILIISVIPQVFAQNSTTPGLPGNLEFHANPSDWIIVGIGVLGGLTSAGLGIAKNLMKTKENEEILNSIVHPDAKTQSDMQKGVKSVLPTSVKFDPGKFARTLLIATITSILLAAGSASLFTELTPITLVMIYAASIGMSSISKPGNR